MAYRLLPVLVTNRQLALPAKEITLDLLSNHYNESRVIS